MHSCIIFIVYMHSFEFELNDTWCENSLDLSSLDLIMCKYFISTKQHFWNFSVCAAEKPCSMHLRSTSNMMCLHANKMNICMVSPLSVSYIYRVGYTVDMMLGGCIYDGFPAGASSALRQCCTSSNLASGRTGHAEALCDSFEAPVLTFLNSCQCTLSTIVYDQCVSYEF